MAMLHKRDEKVLSDSSPLSFLFFCTFTYKYYVGVYQSFLKLRTGVLLTTDLASRGLDIADVDWIVQYPSIYLCLSSFCCISF